MELANEWLNLAENLLSVVLLTVALSLKYDGMDARAAYYMAAAALMAVWGQA